MSVVIPRCFPGISTQSAHDHDEAAYCQRRFFGFPMPSPNGLKRNHSPTAESLSSTPSRQPYSTLACEGYPPPKRLKTESSSLPRPEEQAATQGSLQPSPSAVSGDAVNPSPQHPSVASSDVSVSPRSVPLREDHSVSSGQQNLAASAAPAEPSPTAPGNGPSASSGGVSERVASPSAKMSEPYRLKLRDAIQFEFNQMILKKAEELRLIEQEQAKAQVALEQLRRCRLIPFPGQPGSTVTHDQMLDNTAPALAPPPGHSRPPHPAAWGVQDGPYTRHYAKWLIPDHQFDPEPESRQQRHSTGGQADFKLRESGVMNRRQRHSIGGQPEVANADRVQATPKEKSAMVPQVMRRADGNWVQLKCRECGQMVFKSVQGFMNHVRIQHAIRIKSHAQAASEWGIPVEGPDAALQAAVADASQAASASSSKPSTGHVHVLNTPLARTQRASYPSMDDLIQYSPLNPSFVREKPKAKIDTEVSSGGYISSSNLPALSVLAKKLNGSQDLQRLYAQASEKPDLDAIQPLIPDSEVEEDDTPKHSGDWRKPPISGQQSMSRAPVSGVRIQSRPPSIVVPSSDGPSESNGLSPMTIASHQDTQMTDLSPHTGPPGLVTDHEDDEEMEDEARSVFEHPTNAGGQPGVQNVQIFDESCDAAMKGVHIEGKDLLHQWHPRQPIEHQVIPTMSTCGSTEKKRRGRPSKKDKERLDK